jgi:hypothetical protein
VYETNDFERVVSLLSRTGLVAQHLTAYLKRTDRFAKTIVFCVDQEHAEDMRAALHAANDDLTQQYPHYVARVTADERKVGRGHLDDFVDPEKDVPVILMTSKLLSTGVDAPTCRNIVLFKPIGSIVEFKQIIGRGTRLYPDQDKLSFTIVDYAGATRLFADPNFDGEPERISEEAIYPTAEEQTPPPEVEEEPVWGEGKDVMVDAGTERPPRKYYVDGVEVHIIAEIAYELDSSGKKQRVVAYTDYTKEQVRRLYPTAAELRTEWMNAEHRAAIVQALGERGIDFSTLAEATRQPDAVCYGSRFPPGPGATYQDAGQRGQSGDPAANAQASLAERIFESFVLDVGTMTPLVIPPDDIDGSGILDFSGIPPKRFRTVSLGQQVAEKIHAFTFPWKDRENTRVKDLVDVVLILEVSPPDPRTTRSALEAVFSARAAHPLPISLPHPPGSWANSYSASAKELGLIHTTTEDATRFLGQYWARVFP